MSGRPPLSIVLAVTHPWPAARACLELLADQRLSTGAEIVVADSTGRALPDPLPDCLRGVQTVVVPGASVFELRARATEAAKGSIIAWTEDHCQPTSNWCERILQSHVERPDALVIGGAVQNGSTTTRMDWANFLCTFGPFLPPFGERPIGRMPAVANLSFKRSALPPERLRPGSVELLINPRLWACGKIQFDDSIVVRHIQSWGFWGTPVAHFHNGRSTTGLVVKQITLPRRLARLCVCFALPAEILRTAARPLIGKPKIPVLRCLPLMAGLAIAHSAGEFTGLLLKGPGDSPLRLE